MAQPRVRSGALLGFNSSLAIGADATDDRRLRAIRPHTAGISSTTISNIDLETLGARIDIHVSFPLRSQ